MVEGKQVKVDNWGIFFLQRLNQFYNKAFLCDLTLQFEDNVQVKVHRLVMNACTEYFQMLENKCEVEKDCLMMPSNLPLDVVLPIINFMYSGILEFHESLFERLYATAKLMNMSVLTKLLDAQKQPIKPITPIQKRVQSVTPITWNLQSKKIMTKTFSEPELPETLPGRKLPIWKRKSAPSTTSFLGSNNSNYDYSPKLSKSEEPPKPTRFEWPEEDDSSFENSFDEISYTSKPLIMPTVCSPKEKSPKPSTSTFDEIKKSGPVKRSASPIGNQCKKVNIQDVKEYLKEHKIRSDFIDYDESEAVDGDLQPMEAEESGEESSKDAAEVFQQLAEDTPSKSILKTDTSAPSTPSNKHVRFSLDGKDNKKTTKSKEPAVDMSKHTKIITEVLKKYPHLVKNNKNIRLKILAKGNNVPVKPTTKTQVTPIKPASKATYKVIKPEAKPSSQPEKEKTNENGPWDCSRCEEPKQFKSYHLYRQHLTEVHNEKRDSQMCILCGHISRKQNMLVYHKYVKHNVPPPAMYNFPKCKECNYIALSPVLLTKHQLNHAPPPLNSCAHCDTHFGNKQLLHAHIQQTGHSQDKPVAPLYSCSFCDKRFFSENILNTHVKRTHDKETKTDKTTPAKQVVVAETSTSPSKSKEKIKILSDVKVNAPVSNLVAVKVDGVGVGGGKPTAVSAVGPATMGPGTAAVAAPPEPLEPSSEAEALSNVASGIAASLGLVDTIVVLDDNQFILRSAQGNIQENILNNPNQEYIIPDMNMADLSAIANSNMQVSQPETDTNTALTQADTKPNITSTDELVMVLTDHDYSDAVSNTVMSDNNIVVLYSHPVQTQAMMINSQTSLIQVNKSYTVPAQITQQVVNCEESIEMIQQEINSQLDDPTDQTVQYVQQDPNVQFIQNETNVEYQESMEVDQSTYQVTDNSVLLLNEPDKMPETTIEESIEMIQDEINKIPEADLQEASIKDELKSETMSQSSSLADTPETPDMSLPKCTETIPSTEDAGIEHHLSLNQHSCDYIVQSTDSLSSKQMLPMVETATQQSSDQLYLNSKDNVSGESDELLNEPMETDSVSQDINMAQQEFQQLENQEIVDVNMQQMESQEVPSDIDQLKDSQISADMEQMETQAMSDEIQQLQPEIALSEQIEQPEIKIEQLENQEINIELPLPDPELNAVEEVQNELNAVEDQKEKETEVPQVVEDTQQLDNQINENSINSEAVIEQQTEEQLVPQSETQPDNQLNTKESENVEQEEPEVTPETLQTESEPAQIQETPTISMEQENTQETQMSQEDTQISQDSCEATFSTEPALVEPTNEPTLENVEQDTLKMEELKQKEPQIEDTVAETLDLPSPCESLPNSPDIEDQVKAEQRKINEALQKEKISQLLNDWDDGDTDSQQSFSKVPVVTPVVTNNKNSINKLIDDWEEEEET